MKLLFDQNLSPSLVADLSGDFPGSAHVRGIGLERSMDEAVWNHAREHGFTIVSKDSDFRQLSFLFGHPPKVVWIRRGNCSTTSVRSLLDRRAEILEFERSEHATFLALLQPAQRLPKRNYSVLNQTAPDRNSSGKAGNSKEFSKVALK